MRRIAVALSILSVTAVAEPYIGAMETFNPGKEIVVRSASGLRPYQVVFEDDGTTGYFYALNPTREGNPILDALHIYNAADVTDRHIESEVKIVWSSDGAKAALVINDYFHAVFDFAGKRGYCRTGFPPPAKSWSVAGHDWSDSALDFFAE